ncbi:Aim2 [Kluyveromyces lactis]|nr:Aim2 [Kluyveromyces lactis]
MASNPPGKCCAQGFYHEGTPAGTTTELYGFETYVAGPESLKNEHVLVIVTDIYGIKVNNVLLIADQLAAAGFRVYVPDFLFNDEVVALDGSFDFKSWLERHSAEKTHGLVQDFLTKLKEDNNPKKIGVIGHCFGAKYALLQINEKVGLADAAALAHPSFVEIEEVEAIGKKPVLISAAETDNIFPEELRYKTEEALKKQGSYYQINVFGGVSHGFAVRGDLSIPAVRYAQDKTIEDQISFFKFFFNCI